MKLNIAVLSVLLLSSCSSTNRSADTMKSFIGKDIREVILAKGEATRTVNMQGGVKAYQWVKSRSLKNPSVIQSTGNITASPYNANINQNTIISGGSTINQTCRYTLLTKYDKKLNSWIVDSFKEPERGC